MKLEGQSETEINFQCNHHRGAQICPSDLGPPRPQTPAYFCPAAKVGKNALKPTV